MTDFIEHADVLTANWADDGRDALIVYCRDSRNGEEFGFVMRFSEGLSDNAEYLLGKVKEKYGETLERVVPVWRPPANPAEEKEKKAGEAVEIITKEVARLNSPRYVHRGKKDPKFEAGRLSEIEKWLEVEYQPGFPEEIEWPDIWSL